MKYRRNNGLSFAYFAPVLACSLLLPPYSRAEGASFALPENDLATLQTEVIRGIGLDTHDLSHGDAATLWWAYVTLPSVKAGPVPLFAALELESMHRDMRSIDMQAGRSFLRMGLFGGATLLQAGPHRGSVLIGIGLASEHSDIDLDDRYIHII